MTSSPDAGDDLPDPTHELDPDPFRKVARKQKVQGKEVCLDDAVEFLTKAKQSQTRKKWWDSLQIIIHEETDLAAKEKYSVAKLKCMHCSSLFSATNPSARAASHFEAIAPDTFVCRRDPGRRELIKQNSRFSGRDTEQSSASRAQSVIHTLALSLFTSGKSADFLVNPHFSNALSVLRCSIPLEMREADHLAAVFDQQRRIAYEQLSATDQVSIAFSTCGSDFQAPEGPAMNVMIVPRQGEPMLFSTIAAQTLLRCSANERSALVSAIHAQLQPLMPHTALTGYVLGSAYIDPADLVLLENANPKLIATACFRQCLETLIERLAESLPWLAHTYEECNQIADLLWTSWRARNLLELICGESAAAVVGRRRRDAFGRHMLLRQILQNKMALHAMALDPRWDSTRSTHPDFETVHQIILSEGPGSLFEQAVIAEELVAPIVGAIHQLQFQPSMISQVLPVLHRLETHSAAFAGAHPELASKPGDATTSNVLAIVSPFLRKSVYRWCLPAAFVLDPVNFIKNMMNEWVCPCVQLMDWEAAQARQTIQQLGDEGVLAEWDNFVLESMDSQWAHLLASTLTVQDPFAHYGSAVFQTASPEKRRNFWAAYLSRKYPLLAKVAMSLLSVPATAPVPARAWDAWGEAYIDAKTDTDRDRICKLLFLAENCARAPIDPKEEPQPPAVAPVVAVAPASLPARQEGLPPVHLPEKPGELPPLAQPYALKHPSPPHGLQ